MMLTRAHLFNGFQWFFNGFNGFSIVWWFCLKKFLMANIFQRRFGVFFFLT